MNKKKRKLLTAVFFLSPAFILYTMVVIIPVLQSSYMSFFKWSGIVGTSLKYVGLNNWDKIIMSSRFWLSMKNVCIFIASSFLVIMPLAFGLALIVTGKIKGKKFFKTAFFIPVVLPLTAVGLLFMQILHPQGVVNQLLSIVGLQNLVRNWLGDPNIAIYTVVLVNAWIFTGFNMIIFMSGLVSIPEEIYDAAKIDGATGFSKLLYITVPMLKETFMIFSVLAVTGSLRVFDIIFVMTGGGPAGATNVPATLLYNQSFRYNNFGYGNAIGTTILILALLSTVILNKTLFNDN